MRAGAAVAGELTGPRRVPGDTLFEGDNLRAALDFVLGVKDGVGICVGCAVGVVGCFAVALVVDAVETAEAAPANGGLGLLRAAILSRR